MPCPSVPALSDYTSSTLDYLVPRLERNTSITHLKVVLPEVPLLLLEDNVNLRQVYCRTCESACNHGLKLELQWFHVEQWTLTLAKEISGVGKMSHKHEKG